jgi:acyl-CoA reductase-like NAD-dependent aldehyde dehydrogenase
MTADTDVAFATEPELDAGIQDLTAGAASWAALSLPARIDHLRRTHAAIARTADAWTAAAVAAKHVPAGPLEGEEWITGPYATLAGVAAVIGSLEKIAAGKSPLAGVKTGRAAGNRTTFRMLPGNAYERNLFHGFHADLWLKPGVSAGDAIANAGLGAKRTGENGGVGLVLGAGNISSIGPLDVLYELVTFNRVSVLKLNPTFGTLIGAYRQAFQPLIDANVLRIVNGGAETGQYLTAHPGIAHVHITGSAATHDLIVFGSATDKTDRKLAKPISSELGGISPIIVVPGKWSPANLRFQAENVATQRLHNGGHNCIAGQALILSADWEQKDAFLAELRAVLTGLAPRSPWYPGTERKVASAAASYPDAETINGLMLAEVTPDTSQDLLSTEYFGPVLGYTALPGTGAEFFRAAADFANRKLDGTLGASVIVKPGDRRGMGARFEEILADLRYGSVGVNVWSAFAFLTPTLSWGAFPGSTLDDVGSGIGIVHNSHLVEDVERSVSWGPFRPFPRSVAAGEISLFPKPPWFITARSARETGQKLTRFAAAPSWARLLPVFGQAFRA